MDTKETTMITCRLTPEELQTIDTRASEAGMNRTEYIRTRLFAPDNSRRIAQLEQQFNALTEQLGRDEGDQENRKCSDPEHAKVFGVGHCFICDLPIKSRH
jgi:hypothetical protein